MDIAANIKYLKGVGKRAAHIIILTASCLDESLEFRHYLIPAAVARVVHAVSVVDFLPAVKTEHHVAHLSVGEVDNIVVNEHSVGGQCEAEVLALLLLNAPCVFDKALDHVKIHQRLAAEEIDLEIAA